LSLISAQLFFPTDVSVDAAGNIYFMDQGNLRVRKVDAATGDINTVAGNGTLGFAGDGGPALNASFSNPRSLFVDGAGNIYISDSNNHRVRKVDAATGDINTVAGNGVQGLSGDGGPATSAALDGPFGIFVDAAGHIFFADGGNHRIRRVDAVTGSITTVALQHAGFSGDGGPAINAQILDLKTCLSTGRAISIARMAATSASARWTRRRVTSTP